MLVSVFDSSVKTEISLSLTTEIVTHNSVYETVILKALEKLEFDKFPELAQR